VGKRRSRIHCLDSGFTVRRGKGGVKNSLIPQGGKGLKGEYEKRGEGYGSRKIFLFAPENGLHTLRKKTENEKKMARWEGARREAKRTLR